MREFLLAPPAPRCCSCAVNLSTLWRAFRGGPVRSAAEEFALPETIVSMKIPPEKTRALRPEDQFLISYPRVPRLGMSDHVAVHGHQPDEVLLASQQLGLEPMQRGGQGRTPVPSLRRADQAERRISRGTSRVIQVFVAGQAAVDRLPQEIRQRELRVQSVAGVAQVLGLFGPEVYAIQYVPTFHREHERP
jgi:hypothetical protein